MANTLTGTAARMQSSVYRPPMPGLPNASIGMGPSLAPSMSAYGTGAMPAIGSPMALPGGPSPMGGMSYNGGVSPVAWPVYAGGSLAAPQSTLSTANFDTGSNLAPLTSPRAPKNPNIADPTKAGGGKFWGEDGFNVGDVGTIADVISGFGSIWSGIQANKLAKEEMALQKQAYQTNLASSISSYNLALEDRMRARYTQTDRSQAEASAYIDANRLKA